VYFKRLKERIESFKNDGRKEGMKEGRKEKRMEEYPWHRFVGTVS
jgi:flagellar biosynthesis/type III secretory pathway protein FliH